MIRAVRKGSGGIRRGGYIGLFGRKTMRAAVNICRRVGVQDQLMTAPLSSSSKPEPSVGVERAYPCVWSCRPWWKTTCTREPLTNA